MTAGAAARAFVAPVALAFSRAWRRPGRWLIPALGIALATAFAAVVAVEGTIAGEQASRDVLTSLNPLQRAVRVVWQGPVTAATEREAGALFRTLGLPAPTQVALLNPVRLDGVIVRPAAIVPLSPALAAGSAAAPGPCTPASCPVLLAGGTTPATQLSTAGVHLTIVGRALLRSAAPLGFEPSAHGMPVVVTGDINGLSGLAGLGGIFRTRQWVSELPAARLHSWQLAALERRLELAQARLTAQQSQFALTAPFTALDTARAQAGAAPTRLLLAGGGALAALSLFLVLAVGALRRNIADELDRLRAMGARTPQLATFVATEAGILTAVAILAGAALAVGISAILASAASEPLGGVLDHTLLTSTGAYALIGGWLAATALTTLLLTVRGTRLADLAVAVAAVALVFALALGSGANDSVAVLLAPLSCLAAGVVIYRATALSLPYAERLARRGPLLVRLSFVNLARDPGPAALAVSFIAVSIGLGGFALSYRATLVRGAADEAANAVPLDAIVSPGPDFATPLEVASLAHWRSLAGSGGDAWPVRRTDASYASGYGNATVPALGVPTAALTRLRGWREGDGPAPLASLAQRLQPNGPVRTSGPTLARGTTAIDLRASATTPVSVTAELREADGDVRQITLGTVARNNQLLTAHFRPLSSATELEGFELEEPVGLEATNGHQNAENVAAATQSSGSIVLGPLTSDGTTHELGAWRAVGAAARVGTVPGSSGRVALRFDDSGEPGIVRPTQPTDTRAIPVLVDPSTAASADASGRLAMTIDGQPVTVRVVGVIKRFPTIPAGSSGFVIADEAALAGALDAQLPGQGRPDELWLSTRSPGRITAALRSGPEAQLSSQFRAAIVRRLRAAPASRAVLGTLAGAAALAGALAIVGLLAALLGGARDRLVERDLIEQGIGPRLLRRELALRLVLASMLGVGAGLVLAVLLTRLAVSAVRAAGTLAAPSPTLVTVAPAGQLALWAVGVLAALVAAIAVASALMRRSPAR
jgi:hypothetical protein